MLLELAKEDENLDQEKKIPLCAAPESLAGQSLLNVAMTECHLRQASAVAAEDKGGVSLLIIIIGGSTVLVILCVGILTCYCHGVHRRGRGGVGTQFSQVKSEGLVIETGHGVQYERTCGHEDSDLFVAVRGHKDDTNVPVTVL